MPAFRTKKIQENKDIISNTLKDARQKKGLSLEVVARDLKIGYIYLKAIEKGDFNNLPAGLYGKNFLRHYAELLNLDTRELLKIYDEINEKNKISNTSDLFSCKKPKSSLFFAVPKIIKNLLIVILIIICVGYLGYYVYNIISPPKLIIISPPDNLTIKEKTIKIEGKTEPEARIIINNEVVLIGPGGFFEKTINLKSGVNFISISAQKKYSRQNQITKNILVKTNN